MADETVLRIKERIRQEMRDLLGVTMADGGSIDRQALPAQIDGVAHEVCADFGISDENWIGYIIKSTIDDFIGLGPLQPLQDDPKVAEIFIDPVGVEPNGTFITPVARAEVDGQIVDCPGIDLVLLQAAVASHKEVGGSLADSLERIGDTIDARLSLRRHIESETSSVIASMKALIVMLLILFAIIMVGIPQAYDFYTQDPLGIPVLIVVVLFAATGSVIIYKMADIDVE